MWIYIVRHAWGYDRDPSIWPDDTLRELTPEGKQRYEKMARLLADRGVVMDRIATSPYVRCRQTAEILAAQYASGIEIVDLEALAPGTDIEAVFRWTQSQNIDSVCWVGHAPDVSHLVTALVGRSGENIRFAKGAIAAIQLEDHILYGVGSLHWLVTAKVLGV
ncbi:MAG: phosphohistidine phosphatase SixA [Pirellulales bacterium]|nr:phosphohistidine phosphatase SixA [Pirellulales bacterium]